MREIDIDQLATALDRGCAQSSTSARPTEYAEAHVPGARNIPMGAADFPARRARPHHARARHLRLGQPQLSDGRRAHSRQGFDAVNVAGGTSAWIRSGRPVEIGERPR